ncbi:hypothetical protein [Aquimarina sp. RZ0]|uniref:hypothetical protein n=1 Tax=Aquimarina sp. RZ0 TaxID=2607730 RepID=UPI0011F1D635|nr:hypothetical protein [Aquimarina sp. RZ0]KAA1247931.1 hypothetical protein F0000_01545 [Aquimarina sp. RZ0]
MFDFPFDSTVDYDFFLGGSVFYRAIFDIENKSTFNFGVGFKYKDSYSLELKLGGFNGNSPVSNAGEISYNTVSLLLGFTVF